MFQLSDMWTFFWSFLIVFPIVSIVHQVGHSFFAVLFGGNASFSIGRGKKLFSIGPVSLHRIYFLDSFCKYSPLKWNNRLTHALVHLGGVLFNLGSVFLINALIMLDVVEPHIFYYQYAYFSIYFAAFSLLPVDYGEGKYSDGMSAYRTIRYGERIELFD
ncbi:membrane protein [Jeotgalibacillus soli]|uniref:Putative integral membrane protein n=1 Tax=Jeotgalibacillus soli TaxID=889306 RepID=A0A0C2RNZ7_9BACL|nr:membrane protein [Jeotgalibacillus soli]KIL51980.1 putative integral membrane protein [Jeotgalibacillus soli]